MWRKWKTAYPITVEDGEHTCPLEDCGSTMDYVKIAQGLLYGPLLDQNKQYLHQWLDFSKKRTYEDILLVTKKAANAEHKKGNFDPLYFSIVETTITKCIKERNIGNGLF